MSVIDIIINIFEVIPKDIAKLNSEILIQALFITGFFYFISKWFRVYILRVGLFLLGALILFRVFHGQSFINRFDFYAGVGILLPHISMVELTYFIMREKSLAFLYIITSPFVWLYSKIDHLNIFFKAKQEEENNQKYYKNESKQKQKTNHRKYRNKQKEETKQKPPKQQETKTYEWWESPNNYEKLQLKDDASKSDIEKAKKRLRKLYHPDLVFMDEEKRKKHTIIFQNISNAYEELMKKHKT